MEADVKRWRHVDNTIYDGDGILMARTRTNQAARRLVAALNFVDCVSTEALEGWTVGIITDPINDLAAELQGVLLSEPLAEERRRLERRQGDRRQLANQVSPGKSE